MTIFDSADVQHLFKAGLSSAGPFLPFIFFFNEDVKYPGVFLKACSPNVGSVGVGVGVFGDFRGWIQ